jgi:gamma-glutamyltranspeptidase
VNRGRSRLPLGAVASPHWQATETGAHVLDQGGNALDACVAMNAMLGVVYPHMCGVGGDLFLTYFDAASSLIYCLNGTGRAPTLATPEEIARRGLDAIPIRGCLAATVPGAVHAWQAASERFGSRPLAKLLEPAITAAASGVELTWRVAAWIDANSDALRADPVLRALFLDQAGLPKADGSRVALPALAATLERIAELGATDFYSGSTARSIDLAVREAGGLLRYEDLAAHSSSWVAPISTVHGPTRVHVPPPNSHGITALQMLNILEELRADQLPPGSAGQIDAIVSAKKLAFADRDRHIGDPEFVDIPLTDLLSRERARRLISEASPVPDSSTLGGDTVYVSAVDRSGNACSLIQSIYYAFGSAFVAGDTGVLLHNRGHYFSLNPDSPNVLMPRKRPLHTLIAPLGTENGRLCAVWGSMGADGQPQAVIQVLLRLQAASGAQDAVSAPRFLSGRFTLEDRDDRLVLEEDIGAEVLDGLRELGHDVQAVPPLDEKMGHAHAIVIRGDGTLDAGSDPRSDGRAIVIPA